MREYAEDQVLEWEDVNWQKQLITVRHEVGRQTSRKMGNRRFISMEAALLHWLRPYRKEEGLLIPLVDSAVRRRMKKLCLHSKVNPPNNALRHSYPSYWLARSGKKGLRAVPVRTLNAGYNNKYFHVERGGYLLQFYQQSVLRLPPASSIRHTRTPDRIAALATHDGLGRLFRHRLWALSGS